MYLTDSVCSLLALGMSTLALGVMAKTPEGIPEGKIQVLKKGDIVYIRDTFSADKDLVRQVTLGINKQVNFAGTFLISKSASITAKNKLIHGCGDDACPWKLNRTYIGGNHGCSDGREATVAKHKLTTADVGSEWIDESGTKFYILKITDPSHFVVLSENKGKNGIWKFTPPCDGTLTEKKNGRTLKIEKWKMAQLTPSCRIELQEYLVDGKTHIQENQLVNCDFLDIVEEYDIICPDALVESAKNNPGKKLDFVASGLDYVTNNKITYRFRSNGACEIRYQAEAGRDFKLGYMGFMQTSRLYQGKYDTHEYYIPKTLPFTQKNREIDFQNIIDFSGAWDTVNLYTNRGNYLRDSKNMPERFVQFLGNGKDGKPHREIGYAYGYSLIEGDTKPEIRVANCDSALFLYRSRKSYPHAIDRKMGIIPKGKKFTCVAYRQYFVPNAYSANATDVYWNTQGDVVVLYADYHKAAAKDVIKLPKELVGKSVSVIEKSPSATLLSGVKVPPEGIAFSVKDEYGYIVLRLE